MLHHLSFAVADLRRSSAFYDAVLGAIGYSRVWSTPKAVGYGTTGGGDSFAIKQSAEAPAIPGKGFHVAFSAPTREAAQAFYAAAMKDGATDNGGVGLHPEYGADYYAAFVLDPDGYPIEAVIVGPAQGA